MIGVNIDNTLLSGDSLTAVRGHTIKLETKTGTWTDYFESASGTASRTRDGETLNSAGENTAAATITFSGDTLTYAIPIYTGNHNYTNATSGSYEIGTFTLNPIDAKVGDSLTLVFDPADVNAAKLTYYDSTASANANVELGSYEFDIII